MGQDGTCISVQPALSYLRIKEMGDPFPEDRVWKHEIGYMKWFYRVSHPIMIAPAPVTYYTAHVAPYE